jgi:hypothetical protein
MVTQVGNPSTWEVETGGWKVRGQLGLHSDFEASLGNLVRSWKERRRRRGRRERERVKEIMVGLDVVACTSCA